MMLDSQRILRLIALVSGVTLIISIYAEQQRINCAVHGTCPRQENYGVNQLVDPTIAADVDSILNDMVQYFTRLRSDPKTTIYMHEILDNCRNEDEQCAYWAMKGECEKSPGHMQTHCAPVCRSCDQLSRANRCPPIDPEISKTNVWIPGSVNELFHNLTTMPEYRKYEAKVLSRPTYVGKDNAKTASYQLGPWLMYFDKFMTNSEADKIVAIGDRLGFKPLVEAMRNQIPGNSAPTFTWIGPAHDDRNLLKIMHRIEKLSNVPYNNFEDMQLLRYEVGQAHPITHENVLMDTEREPGIRILSWLLCLSDVEAGGMEDFFQLQITIPCKKGRAILWPTVLNEDPNRRDDMMHHNNSAVKKGVKYVGNVWIHQRDYKGPSLRNCH